MRIKSEGGRELLMSKVVISLGSNLGDSPEIMARAIQSLKSVLFDVEVSSIIETAPWGFEDQPNFLNAVVVGEFAGNAFELLSLLQEMEQAEKRVRDIRWGPRTLDLDIITFGDEVIESSELQIPHPRAHERAFVLEPWLEIEPDAEIPQKGRVVNLLELLK
jgi:2-amino-4-hydroxy-6-hydroxymethyldihydropteridine diphosphokinase